MRNLKYNAEIIIVIFCTCIVSIIGLSAFNEIAMQNMKGHDKAPLYFGATYMTMNNPYFGVINDEIKKVVEGEGDILITLDPALSLDRQIDQIHYLIEKKVKAIFLNPVDINGLADTLEECKKEKIPVIVVDSDVNQKESVAYTIVSDNYDAGVQAAKDMMKRVDHGNILLLEHNAANSGVLRIQGFVDTIEAHSEYHISKRIDCEGQLEKATPLVSEALDMGYKFDVIMALNDPSAMGALAALQEKQLDGVLVYGVDGTPEGKALIRANKMQGSVAQSPIQMGRRAVNVAYKTLRKEFKNKTEKIPVHLITKENIGDYNIEGWQ